MPAAVQTHADEAHWTEAKRRVRATYPDVDEGSDRFWRITMGIFQDMKAAEAFARCTAVMAKAMVRGHYIVVNGKRVWIREHQRIDRTDQPLTEEGDPGVSFGTPPAQRDDPHHRDDSDHPTEEPGEASPGQPQEATPPLQDPSATALPGSGPGTVGRPKRHDQPLQHQLATAANLPLQAVSLTGPLDAAALFCYLRGSVHPKVLGVYTLADGSVAGLAILTLGATTKIPPTALAAGREAARQQVHSCWLVQNGGQVVPCCTPVTRVMTAVARPALGLLATGLHGTVCLGVEGYVAVNGAGTTLEEGAYPEEERAAASTVQTPDEVATLGCQLLRGGVPQTYLLVLGRSSEVQAALPVTLEH